LLVLNQFQSFVFLTLMKEVDNVNKGGHWASKHIEL
jgi:hypothetical protein